MAEPEAERRTENDCIVYEMNFVLQSQFLNSFSGQSLLRTCEKSGSFSDFFASIRKITPFGMRSIRQAARSLLSDPAVLWSGYCSLIADWHEKSGSFSIFFSDQFHKKGGIRNFFLMQEISMGSISGIAAKNLQDAATKNAEQTDINLSVLLFLKTGKPAVSIRLILNVAILPNVNIIFYGFPSF